MRQKLKTIGALSLFFWVPSLIAISPEEAESFTGYDDFTVTVKEKDNIKTPNLYEFTINNYGDGYLEKNNIKQKGGDFIRPIAKECLQNSFVTLIQPKEICVLESYVDPSWNLLEGEYNNFSGISYSVRNDIVSVSGPYSFSIKENEYSNVLEINCTITELKNIENNEDIHYSYFYAISMTYDGEDFCVITNTQNNFDKITTSFKQEQKIDPEKLVINKIDSFVSINRSMSCIKEPLFISLFKFALLILGSLIAFALVFCVIVVVRRKDKTTNPKKFFDNKI